MFKFTVIIATFFAAGLSAACSAEGITDSAAISDSSSTIDALSGGQPGPAGQVRVRCELRQNRSKVSVDGNNLRPQGGLFSARIRSGGNSASAPQLQAVGDEAEFDFDSAADDIAAGATAIAANFIQIGTGSDVTAELLNATGVVVASGSADCTVS